MKPAANKVVSIVLLDGTDQLIITGPHGHATVKVGNPVELGIHVIEVLTGDQVAPSQIHACRKEGQ